MKKVGITLLVLLVMVSVAWPFLFGFGVIAALVSLGDDEDVVKQAYTLDYERGDEESTNKILSIKVFGPILDQRKGRLNPFDDVLAQGVTYGYEVKEVLMQVAEDPDVDGVVLEIASPGGTVTGSQAIADGVEYYKSKTGKPVYAFGSGLMASGAYWAAVAADVVYADIGSLVGSIGVIGGMFPVFNDVIELGQGVLGPNVVTREGIDMVTITAGEGKDFGNSFRTPTEKELAIAQRGVDDAYSQFVDHVSVRRGIAREVLVSEVGAHVYGEVQAQGMKLIDGMYNREEVYQRMAAQLGVGENFQIVSPRHEGDFFSSVLGVAARWGGTESSSGVSSQSPCSIKRAMVYYGELDAVCPML